MKAYKTKHCIIDNAGRNLIGFDTYHEAFDELSKHRYCTIQERSFKVEKKSDKKAGKQTTK